MIDYAKMTTEELIAARDAIEIALRERQGDIAKHELLNLNINGKTVRDLVALCEDDPDADHGISYSFCLVHEGELYDIYYDTGDDRNPERKFVPYEWWPWADNADGEELRDWDNRAAELVPPGFDALSENSWGFYDGTHEDAIARLQEYGVIALGPDETTSWDELYKKALAEREKAS